MIDNDSIISQRLMQNTDSLFSGWGERKLVVFPRELSVSTTLSTDHMDLSYKRFYQEIVLSDIMNQE